MTNLAVDYVYEFRRGDEIVATGHLSREQPLQVGDEMTIAGRTGVVRLIEPHLGDQAVHLVLQQLLSD